MKLPLSGYETLVISHSPTATSSDATQVTSLEALHLILLCSLWSHRSPVLPLQHNSQKSVCQSPSFPVRRLLWKQVYGAFKLIKISPHAVLHCHYVAQCKSQVLKHSCLAISLKCCTFPGHSHSSICHPSITAQPYHSCDRLSGPWRVLTYLLPSNIPAHWCMQKSTHTEARANRTDMSGRSLLSAQWLAPRLQFLSECHWLVSRPRTAPDTACVA